MPDSCLFVLRNNSTSSEVYAYITGIAIQHNGARVLIESNCKNLYFPESPNDILQPLKKDCAIPLGPPGSEVTVNVPQIAGGRIWISMGGKLTFLVNPGPALVEPSVLNPSDPNATVNFGFCEFTLNHDQLFANISYVDFVPRIPIALRLENTNGHVQEVAGMPPDGLDRVCNALIGQAQKDGIPWDKLVVRHKDENLRALNATHGYAVGANFDGYFEQYVEKVWKKYSTSCCRIDTQAAHGILEGRVNDRGEFVVGNERFTKPTTADILGCNSGPFTTGPSPERNSIIPRLAAAFVRTTLLCAEDHPSQPQTFYREDPTNHYARIVHENNIDGKGYAFAYGMSSQKANKTAQAAYLVALPCAMQEQ
ncbi:hypothetical protein, variant [Verruconis gallopava]|uniref:GH64 domain-containing protein n=1 Tax=Verruconis gallopava TaxID=253628 RepID=A0A0D2AI86_9PEZI|nr:hypothetical protein, variant [Verruconis gallopava]KIW06295.1 hypothetical protein, variant [Verruconis gallopava]